MGEIEVNNDEIILSLQNLGSSKFIDYNRLEDGLFYKESEKDIYSKEEKKLLRSIYANLFSSGNSHTVRFFTSYTNNSGDYRFSKSDLVYYEVEIKRQRKNNIIINIPPLEKFRRPHKYDVFKNNNNEKENACLEERKRIANIMQENIEEKRYEFIKNLVNKNKKKKRRELYEMKNNWKSIFKFSYHTWFSSRAKILNKRGVKKAGPQKILALENILRENEDYCTYCGEITNKIYNVKSIFGDERKICASCGENNADFEDIELKKEIALNKL